MDDRPRTFGRNPASNELIDVPARSIPAALITN
jgi:hypothetical protein